MRQILYISSSTTRGVAADVDTILRQSRNNNAIEGVTGLLYTDGTRFLQVLEGPEESVASTYARIAADPRHRAIVVLSDRSIEEREFGSWSMAHRVAGEEQRADETIRRALENAAPEVRGTFEGLVTVRR